MPSPPPPSFLNLRIAPRSREGFTILELMVVVAIASVILGASIAGYVSMNKSLAFGAAHTLIQGQLLAARSTAISEHGGSFVIIDCKKNKLQSFGKVTRGVWHFDIKDGAVGDAVTFTSGAFSQVGHLLDGSGNTFTSTLVKSKFGAALEFPGAQVDASQQYYVECGQSPAYVPAYNAREGIALEAWVYPLNQSGGSPLADNAFLPIVAKIGTQASPYAPYALYLKYSQADNKFRAGGLVSLDEAGGTPTVQEVSTSNAVLAPGRWAHVAMTYTNDSAGLRVFVNGTLRATSGDIGTKSLVLNPQPVHIGHTENSARSGSGPTSGFFAGRIDEVILGVYRTHEPKHISGPIYLVVMNPAETETDQNFGRYAIHFDAQGGLDRQYHSALPEVLILSPTVEWQPAPRMIYGTLQLLNNFREQNFKQEAERKRLAHGGRIYRSKVNWAGTLE